MKCSVTNCGNAHYGNGYCSKHYMQIRSYGKILERTIQDPNDFIIEGEICKIGCYNQKCELVGYTIINTKHVDKCKPYKWCFDSGYVTNHIVGRLHNFILGIDTTSGVVGDHRNRNTWDNREENLRICTQLQNTCNAGKRKDNSSGYKGVCKHKVNGTWVASITKNGVRHYLGSFGTPESAALAYNQAASKLHGEFAVLNLIRRRSDELFGFAKGDSQQLHG